VPPVLLPVFFVLLIAAAVVFNVSPSPAWTAQQNPSGDRNGQQSNCQECVWSAGHVRRIENRQ
jgi:hypothetical protein